MKSLTHCKQFANMVVKTININQGEIGRKFYIIVDGSVFVLTPEKKLHKEIKRTHSIDIDSEM